MAITHLTEKNVIDILSATNLESSNTHTADPIVKSRIRVTLDQLRPYDNNPRTTRNPKFEDILLSIENAGLEQPPNISRRCPDDPHYMIIDGGNTRLEILKILYEKYKRLADEAESDEARLRYSEKAESFYVIECVFKPWVSESRALAGHMSENENRGDMLFIEKAVAVQKLRQFYEIEDREKAQSEGCEFEGPLSIRKLAERITAQGWPIHNSHISRYDYAVNTLLKVIPNALWAGAGQPLVRTIRKHDVAFTQFWQKTEVGEAESDYIESNFFNTLQQYDGESFDLKGFLQALTTKIGKRLDLHPTAVMAEIDAIVNGRVVSPAPLADSPGSSRESLVQKYKASAPPGSQIGSERQGSAITDTNTKDSKKNTKPRFDETNEERLYKRVRTLAMQFGLDIVYLNKHERGGFPILFGVAPINRVLIPGKDEELATVWWALAKYSLSFRSDEQNQYAGFLAVLEKQFSQYFERLNGPLGTLLFFEEAILGISSEIRDQLQEIQHLCGLLLQEIATD